LVFTLSCSHPAAPALTREAFLAFDNLTGDPALDWIANAAPQIIEHDLTGVPKIIPLFAPTVRDAFLEHTARLVHGYYELRSGKLHFEISVEDATDHRTLGTSAADGEPADAMNRAAKALAAGASVFPASEAATAAWGRQDYERAVTLDPTFALAWLAWAQQASSSGDRPKALDLVQRGLAQPALDSSLDQAQLQLAAANLSQDDAARLTASRKLSELIPFDPAQLTSLAELDMADRNFAAAARDYQLAHMADPSESGVLNSLGYAQALAGNLDEARKSFQEYGRGPGESAINSIDSLGEALFVNGKFDEAERQFLDAYKKDPKFLQGETLWKAAHARFLAGDLPAADKLAGQYFQDRAKARDPLLTWRRANWLYETGRREQAVDLLMHAPDATPSAIAAAKQQLTIWNAPQLSGGDPAGGDLEKLKESYRHSDPVNDGLPRIFYAEALLHAGRKDEARELLKRWPLPIRDNAPLQSLLYPKFLELRRNLR
jgi:Tfp pilus assembly protein PilF